MGKNIKTEDGLERKRGRPAGKNRAPLSKAERLARSARYEKERREQIAAAMTDLADAIGCDRDIRNCDLLATVVSFIESRTTHTNSEVDSLRKENQELQKQIRCMERQLTKKSVEVTPQRPLPSSASNVEAAFAYESPLISSEQYLSMDSEEVPSQLVIPPTLLTPPLLPEDIFELDFAAALPLGPEGVGMHNPSGQAASQDEVQAQTMAGNSESILPPDILDFILEYT